MGKRAVAIGDQNVSSTAITALLLIASASVRVRLYELLLSCIDTPDDKTIIWDMLRSTASGTSTSVTPRLKDPADPAAVATAGKNHTVEPTYTADSELFKAGVNQRVYLRWVANPGAEHIIPASANAGVGLRVLHASATANMQAVMEFEE